MAVVDRAWSPRPSCWRSRRSAIRLREPILEPDALIVQDPTLLKAIDVFQGLRPAGYLLVNTNKELADLDVAAVVAKLSAGHARTVPASELALKHVGRPVPNAALLGAFAALTGVVRLDSVAAAIRAAFPGSVGEANVVAAIAAFEALASPAAAAA